MADIVFTSFYWIFVAGFRDEKWTGENALCFGESVICVLSVPFEIGIVFGLRDILEIFVTYLWDLKYLLNLCYPSILLIRNDRLVIKDNRGRRKIVEMSYYFSR